MNWLDLVPESVALEQVAWERGARLCRMQDVGMTLREIGLREGVSRSRIGLICQRHRRRLRWHPLPPVQKYAESIPVLAMRILSGRLRAAAVPDRMEWAGERWHWRNCRAIG